MSWVVIYVSTPTLPRPTQLAVAVFQKHFHGSQAVLFLVHVPRQSELGPRTAPRGPRQLHPPVATPGEEEIEAALP